MLLVAQKDKSEVVFARQNESSGVAWRENANCTPRRTPGKRAVELRGRHSLIEIGAAFTIEIVVVLDL